MLSEFAELLGIKSINLQKFTEQNWHTKKVWYEKSLFCKNKTSFVTFNILFMGVKKMILLSKIHA